MQPGSQSQNNNVENLTRLAEANSLQYAKILELNEQISKYESDKATAESERIRLEEEQRRKTDQTNADLEALKNKLKNTETELTAFIGRYNKLSLDHKKLLTDSQEKDQKNQRLRFEKDKEHFTLELKLAIAQRQIRQLQARIPQIFDEANAFEAPQEQTEASNTNELTPTPAADSDNNRQTQNQALNQNDSQNNTQKDPITTDSTCYKFYLDCISDRNFCAISTQIIGGILMIAGILIIIACTANMSALPSIAALIASLTPVALSSALCSGLGMTIGGLVVLGVGCDVYRGQLPKCSLFGGSCMSNKDHAYSGETVENTF